MSEKGILKKIDDIFNYCEEIDNHLPKEEQTGYRMLPDIFYIQEEVRNLQQKVEQLENIRKEAIEFMKENCDIITIDKGWIIRSELTTTGLGKLFKILNKGDNNGK